MCTDIDERATYNGYVSQSEVVFFCTFYEFTKDNLISS